MKVDFTKDELAVIMAGVSLLLNTVYKNPQDLKLKDNKVDNYTDLSLIYNEKNLLIKSWNAFKNKAIFTDSNNRLFIKEFNKINI